MDGFKDGIGTYTFSTGEVYHGEWEKGEKFGQGRFTWKDGSIYSGKWRSNKLYGHGIYYWPDGDSFEGQWVNNCRVKGIFSDTIGYKIVQQWNDDSSSSLTNVKDLTFAKMM